MIETAQKASKRESEGLIQGACEESLCAVCRKSKCLLTLLLFWGTHARAAARALHCTDQSITNATLNNLTTFFPTHDSDALECSY